VDSSSVRKEQGAQANLRPAARAPSIPPVPALQVPEDQAPPEAVPALARVQDLAALAPAALAVRVLAVRQVHLRVKPRARNVRRIIADAAVASNTRRPRKAR